MAHAVIRTIGYEKSGFGDFARTLKDAGVTRVLDVRELPLSRRAGFSKRQLAAGLAECGITYSHLKGLGTPKDGRVAARAGRKEEFHEIFAAHMKTQRAQDELVNAKALVEAEPCCLLCFEADEKCCHRLVVAKALETLTGLPVVHLHVT
jgi:uncharacterized protein (DUF488 family)